MYFFLFTFRMYFKIILMLAFLDGFQNSGAVGKTSLEMIQAKDENIVIKTCTLERVYRLIGYDCANMNLKEIPQHLKTSLEVRKAITCWRSSF